MHFRNLITLLLVKNARAASLLMVAVNRFLRDK